MRLTTQLRLPDRSEFPVVVPSPSTEPALSPSAALGAGFARNPGPQTTARPGYAALSFQAQHRVSADNQFDVYFDGREMLRPRACLPTVTSFSDRLGLDAVAMLILPGTTKAKKNHCA